MGAVLAAQTPTQRGAILAEMQRGIDGGAAAEGGLPMPCVLSSATKPM